MFEIARMMGTSIEMIDKTYGHLLAVSAEAARARMDAFDPKSDERERHLAEQWEYLARNLTKIIGPGLESDFNKLG
jgi:hypothetical protein